MKQIAFVLSVPIAVINKKLAQNSNKIEDWLRRFYKGLVYSINSM